MRAKQPELEEERGGTRAPLKDNTGATVLQVLSYGMLLFAILATAVAVVEAVLLFAKRKPSRLLGAQWRAPSPDPGRYQVVFHFQGETRELYHGYDALAARHAYEQAPMEAGMIAEFYEWGQKRGSKSA